MYCIVHIVFDAGGCRALAKVLPQTSCVLRAVENNRQMWFRANEQLIERGLPRNMEVFRHLDSLVLWQNHYCHNYTGFMVNHYMCHCGLFYINFTVSSVTTNLSCIARLVYHISLIICKVTDILAVWSSCCVSFVLYRVWILWCSFFTIL